MPRNFYEQPTLIIAGELLGKVLKLASFYGVITEVEAYIGMDDPACHAVKGYTNRTSVMFGPPWVFICISYIWNILLFKYRNRNGRISSCSVNTRIEAYQTA